MTPGNTWVRYSGYLDIYHIEEIYNIHIFPAICLFRLSGFLTFFLTCNLFYSEKFHRTPNI